MLSESRGVSRREPQLEYLRRRYNLKKPADT